jgi:hypothetical protein
MNKPRRAFGWICTGLLLSAAVEACSASSSPELPGGSAAVGGGAGTNMGDGTVVEPLPSGGDGGESTYNPLCGVPSDGCLPDDSEACPDGLAGAGNSSGGRGGGAGSGGSAGAKAGAAGSSAVSGRGGTPAANGGDSGEGGESASIPGGNGGEAGSAAGEGGATPNQPPAVGGDGNGGEGGTTEGASGAGQGGAGSGGDGGQSGGGGAGSDGGSVPWPYSCQVRVTSSRDVVSVCKPAGSGKVGDGCFSGADCAAGLGCVGERSPGQCRPYCCEGSDSCVERGTHCTEERLVGETSQPRVPVCMPATGCDLAEKECTGGATCTCPEDEACVVVAGDGTTSCVPRSSLPSEGNGLAGAMCPCAFGHFCSEATNRCVKLCQTTAPSGQAAADGGVAGCGRGRCQASPGLPTGWGVCIGSE